MAWRPEDGSLPLGFLGGNLVGITPGRPDFESQLRGALQNITTILEALGTSPDRVAKVKAYITDFRYFDRYNSTYREFFTPPYPARASIGAGLARENASDHRGRSNRCSRRIAGRYVCKRTIGQLIPVNPFIDDDITQVSAGIKPRLCYRLVL